MAAVEKATANFVERGQQIAAENPEIQRDMIEAVHDVQATGEAMSSAARDFASDPCSSVKRGNMVSRVFGLSLYGWGNQIGGVLFLSARRALLCFLCWHDLSMLFVGFIFVICGILLGYL